MNNKILTLLVLLLMTSPITLSLIAESKKGGQNSPMIINSYNEGYRYNIQGWVYVHIEGDPYERGYQYGYLASAEIEDMIERWVIHVYKDVKILNRFPFKDPKKAWNIFKSRAKSNFLKDVPEEYKDELRGLTDGLKAKGVKIFNYEIEFDDVVASQFVQDVEYSSFVYIKKRFHPLRGLVHRIKETLTKGIKDSSSGHCTAFIATGDATADGGIVAAHSTIYATYLAERCNIILDVQPSNGNRFIMTCPPGSIWSQEDWYQNEKGIILTETEFTKQCPFRIIGNIPKGVRSRTAIQYSDSIDDVIKILKHKNNGLIPNEWLIGDTKTGEIASLQLAYFNTPVKRTFNGYYWSCCIAHDPKVIAECEGIPVFAVKIGTKISPDTFISKIAKKFIELGEQYYGTIDIRIAKIIMSTPPIVDRVTDGKITDSNLMKKLGLIACMGKPDGSQWDTTDEYKKKYNKATELPSSGFVKIYPSNSKPTVLKSISSVNYNERDSRVFWQYETNDNRNIDYSSNTVSEDVIHVATSSGIIYALNTNRGRVIWKSNVEGKAVEPVVSKDLLFVGTDIGLYALNKETGEVRWEQLVGDISSKPIVADNLVIASCLNGEVYAFNADSGTIKWTYDFLDSAYVSELDDNVIYVGSGDICHALDVDTREVLWSYETDGSISTSPAINENTVYFGSWDGNVYALDSDTGNFKWKYETGWGIDTTPAISDGLAYIGSNDNNFYCLNAEDGELEWFFNCKSAIHSSPTIYGEYVFFGSDDGRLYALEKTTGDLMWSFTPGYSIEDDDVNNYITTPILSDPIAEDGMVYIGAKGVVYALDAQTVELIANNLEEDALNYNFIVILIVILTLIILIVIYKKSRKERLK